MPVAAAEGDAVEDCFSHQFTLLSLMLNVRYGFAPW